MSQYVDDGYYLLSGIPPLIKVIKSNSGMVGLTQDNRIVSISTDRADLNKRNTIREQDIDLDYLVSNVLDMVSCRYGQTAILLENGNVHQLSNNELIATNIIKIFTDRASGTLYGVDRDEELSELIYVNRELPLRTIVNSRQHLFITESGFLFYNRGGRINPIHIDQVRIIDAITQDRDVIYAADESGVIYRYNWNKSSYSKIEHHLFKHIQFKRFIEDNIKSNGAIVFEDIEGDLYSIYSNGAIGSINLGFKLYGYQQSPIRDIDLDQ